MSNINLQVFFYHNFVLYRFENCSKLVEKLMVISFNVYLVRNRIVKRLLNFIVKVFSKNWFRQWTTCLIATPAMHDGRSRALHSNVQWLAMSDRHWYREILNNIECFLLDIKQFL